MLLWGMVGGGYTPQCAAGLAVIAGAALLLAGGDLRVDLRRTARRAEPARLTAARQIAGIGSIVLCASLVIGSSTSPGSGRSRCPS